MIDKYTIDFYEIVSFSRNIISNRSRIAKKNILINSKTEFIKRFLSFLVDDNVTTGISDSRINKSLHRKLDPDIKYGFLDVCEYISNNPSNDDTLWVAQSYIEKIRNDNQAKDNPEFYVNFAKSVFTKKLRIGVDTKTVNSAYGYALIPCFDVQLAKSIENVNLKKNVWFSISRKVNGNRCVCYRGRLFSRQGKEWVGLNGILDGINTLIDTSEFCLDGELVYDNHEGLSDNEAFIKGTGILNSINEDKSCIKYIIFDCITNDDFDSGVSKLSYKDRKDKLLYLKGTISKLGIKNIEIVEFLYEGYEDSKIDYWLNYATEHDMEGIMLNYNVPYQSKRHAGIIKVKKFYTMDLQIYSVDEGDGRLSGTLGKVNVIFEPNGYTYNDRNLVGVGSGFSDELRSDIWNNKNKYIGKFIEVKYKNISKDKITGMPSLQFPVFVRFREDKKDPSYD